MKKIVVHESEQGMAMVMALLMGVVLLAGTTALMIRQMTSRKLGAAESYNQLAESAALNGLNRIISDLNENDRDNYTGFLLTLRNDEAQWGWSSPNDPEANTQLVELCTPVDKYIKAYPFGTDGEASPVQINAGNIRADGIAQEIEVSYRLRKYTTTASEGDGTGTFFVEGIVQLGENILARALLERKLFISSRVAGTGDWAVISGHNLRLNDTTINGPGNIFYLTKFPDNYSADNYSSRCRDELLNDVGATNQDLAGENNDTKIWPINIDEEKRGINGMPPTILFEKDFLKDKSSNSDSEAVRVWSFDDNPAPEDRDGDGFNDIDENGEEILYPQLPCGEAVCIRDADKTSKDDFRTLAEEGVNLGSDPNTIKLSRDTLCPNSDGFDCHVYLDHVKLNKTALHFEVSNNSAIVLHLDQPVSYPTDLNLSQAIDLSGSAELCGVNDINNSCNGRPEQLIITSSSEEAPTANACGQVSQSVRFTGTTLPDALIYLPAGTVRPNNANLTGLVWANSICVLDENDGNSSFTLNTDQNGIAIVQKANDHWGWSERFKYAGYGRKVTRAIRGTSLDIFKRW